MSLRSETQQLESGRLSTFRASVLADLRGDLARPGEPFAGQLEFAVRDRVRFAEWGRDYLNSVARFHELQVPGNGVEEGFGGYRTPAFEAARLDTQHAQRAPDISRSFFRAQRNAAVDEQVAGAWQMISEAIDQRASLGRG